ncbi:glycosyltransferase family 9 protein [Kribbella sp. NBC_01505]|uniref:glycosyltransferase family 9 protein n=1 Tax=Kribbella sp. NBC_01505 TaxID=2903580 RepID=UPI00386A3EFD
MPAVERICVFAQLHLPGLGDLLLRNALLALVRRAHPDASVTLVVGDTLATQFAELLDRHMYLTDVLRCPDPYDQTAESWLTFMRELADRDYQLCVVDPDSHLLDAGHARAAGIGQRLAQPRGELSDQDITHPVRLAATRFATPDLYEVMCGYAVTLGLDGSLRPADVVPDLPRWPEELPELDAVRPRIVVHPGGAVRFNRRWPLERFAELCVRLVEQFGASLYLLGTRAEAVELTLLRDQVRGRHPGGVVQVAIDGSLNRSANLIAGADLLIGNDSGPGHLAAAVGTPSVIIYGPGSGMAWLARVYTRLRVVSRYTCRPLNRPLHHGLTDRSELPRRFRCENGCTPRHQGPTRPLWQCEEGCEIEYQGPRGPYPKCLVEIDVAKVCASVTAALRH